LDGRLDNREEIVSALGLQGRLARDASDARLVFAAFERWGEDCLSRFVGPMALIFYDPTARRVLLSRDPVGNRGLYYHLSPRLLVAASAPFALLAHPEVREELDEERIAQFFASRLDDDRTFFSGVSAIPPGQSLVVEADRVRRRSFWRFKPNPEIGRAPADENAERFRELLGESVRCRLRSRGAPTLMLSGGLDSTSIAATCQLQGVPVRSLTWSFEELESCDETRFAGLLESGSGAESLEAIPGDDAWPLANPSTWLVNPNTPEENAYRRLHERCFHRVRNAGSQVVLNGMFGDQLFLGTEGWLFDLLRRGQLGTALSNSIAEARAVGAAGHLRRSVAAPLKRWYQARRARSGGKAPPWLTPLASAMLSKGRGILPPDCKRPGQYEAVLGSINAHGVAMEGWHTHREGVEVRFPYRDRRLIELALALPTSQLFSPRKRRPIVREAMRGLLPEEIRLRQSKTSFAPLFRRGIEDREKGFVLELLQSPSRLWDRYVDRSWLFSSKLGEEPWPEKRLFVLWLCICFELWLRSDSARNLSRSGTLLAALP